MKDWQFFMILLGAQDQIEIPFPALHLKKKQEVEFQLCSAPFFLRCATGNGTSILQYASSEIVQNCQSFIYFQS